MNVTVGAARGARRELDDGAVRPHDAQPGRAAGHRQGDRVAGLDRLGRRGAAAEQLAGQVRDQDRERDLERQVGLRRGSNARTAVGTPARTPA